MLLKLRVARLDGAQPTLGQYALRWLLRFVDVTLTSGVVAVVAVSATRRQQRLGDLAAGTTVVRVRRRVRLDEVLYPDPPRGYTPRFPDAAALTDADVRTLRAVLVRTRLSARDRRGTALAARAKAAVEARLGLPAVDMEPRTFSRRSCRTTRSWSTRRERVRRERHRSDAPGVVAWLLTPPARAVRMPRSSVAQARALSAG